MKHAVRRERSICSACRGLAAQGVRSQQGSLRCDLDARMSHCQPEWFGAKPACVEQGRMANCSAGVVRRREDARRHSRCTRLCKAWHAALRAADTANGRFVLLQVRRQGAAVRGAAKGTAAARTWHDARCGLGVARGRRWTLAAGRYGGVVAGVGRMSWRQAIGCWPAAVRRAISLCIFFSAGLERFSEKPVAYLLPELAGTSVGAAGASTVAGTLVPGRSSSPASSSSSALPSFSGRTSAGLFEERRLGIASRSGCRAPLFSPPARCSLLRPDFGSELKN